jgi:hypothetical protein
MLHSSFPYKAVALLPVGPADIVLVLLAGVFVHLERSEMASGSLRCSKKSTLIGARMCIQAHSGQAHAGMSGTRCDCQERVDASAAGEAQGLQARRFGRVFALLRKIS